MHIRVVVENEDMFTRVKRVVADHLERFAANEDLHINWVERQLG